MSIRRLFAVALVGCQAKAEQVPPPPPTGILVRDHSGTTIAELHAGHPCRVTIDRTELLVGEKPLVAQNGEARWTGETAANGTTIARDGTPIARVYETGGELSVLDPDGVALARFAAGKVFDASGALIRQLVAKGDQIAVDPPDFTITGTSDLVLAALLSAPELGAEIRGLAACERTFQKGS